jgi:threonyl-tRNA synthetase
MGSRLLAVHIGLRHDRRFSSWVPAYDTTCGAYAPGRLLLEHHAGRLPAWLSPVHAVLLSITDRQHEYLGNMADLLKKQGLLVEADLRNEKVGFKIREHTLQRVPYLLVAGDKEVAANSVAVRSRDGKDLGTMSPQTFAERLRRELESRGRHTLEE